MVYLKQLDVRPRACALRHSLLSLCILIAGTSGASDSVLQAAPVTFRFIATVADGIDSPFLISPGDTIAASFTFEPGNSGPIYPQFGLMRFQVAGMILEVPEFQIKVANDELRWIDVAGRIADPNNAPDTDFNEIGDNIIASCRDGGSLFCGTVPDRNNFAFQPLVVFANENGLLASNDLLADPNLWNSFSLREMSLMFRNADTGTVTYVGAYVGQIEQVPEPSTLCLLLGFICVIAARLALSRQSINHRPSR